MQIRGGGCVEDCCEGLPLTVPELSLQILSSNILQKLYKDRKTSMRRRKRDEAKTDGCGRCSLESSGRCELNLRRKYPSDSIEAYDFQISALCGLFHLRQSHDPFHNLPPL